MTANIRVSQETREPRNVTVVRFEEGRHQSKEQEKVQVQISLTSAASLVWACFSERRARLKQAIKVWQKQYASTW